MNLAVVLEPGFQAALLVQALPAGQIKACTGATPISSYNHLGFTLFYMSSCGLHPHKMIILYGFIGHSKDLSPALVMLPGQLCDNQAPCWVCCVLAG